MKVGIQILPNEQKLTWSKLSVGKSLIDLALYSPLL